MDPGKYRQQYSTPRRGTLFQKKCVKNAIKKTDHDFSLPPVMCVCSTWKKLQSKSSLPLLLPQVKPIH